MTRKSEKIYEKILSVINRESKEAVDNFMKKDFKNAIYLKVRGGSGGKHKISLYRLKPVFVSVALLVGISISLLLITNSMNKSSNQSLLTQTKEIFLLVPAFTTSLKSLAEEDILPSFLEREGLSKGSGINLENNLNLEDRIRRLGRLFLNSDNKKPANGEQEG
jgi:hypothetical protein